MESDGLGSPNRRRWVLRASGGAGWVVRDVHGELIASVGVAPSGDATCELKRLYVDARARRRGLGAALVAVVEAWARAHGAGRVELWSDTRFGDAHRLYARLGYADTGARRDLHDPSHTTELHMVRTLPVPPAVPPAGSSSRTAAP